LTSQASHVNIIIYKLLEVFMKLEPPPRKTKTEIARAIRKQRKMLFLIGLILALSGAGTGVFLYLLTVPAHLKNLDSTGAAAEGVIDSMVEHGNVHYGNVHPWGIGYHFTAASGGIYHGETETTDLEFVRTHSAGDRITISYAASNPRISKIQGVEIAGISMWFLLIPAGELAVGLLLLLVRHIRIAGALEVYEMGTETQGRILSAKPLKSVHMGTKHPVSIKYAFEDEMGQECFGKVWSWHPGARELARGQACTVLYNRANPGQSILYDSLALYLEQE
jgi:hypothetical protein